MAIRTSAIFYRRGIPSSNNNFGFVAQTNNNVFVPMNKYLKGYNFYNRQPVNTNSRAFRGALFPWSH
jgi:hypothetical protein